MDSVEAEPQFKCLSKREKIDFLIYGLGLDPKDAVILKNLHLDLEDLLMLTDDDIRQLGIKDSTLRKKLFTFVEKYKLKTSVFKKHQADGDDKIETNIILQDSLTILVNNSKHLEYIHDSLHFIDRKLNIDEKIPNFMLSPQHSLGEGLEIISDANQKQIQSLIDSLKKLEGKIYNEMETTRWKRKKSNGPIYICLCLLLSSSIIFGISTWKIRK